VSDPSTALQRLPGSGYGASALCDPLAHLRAEHARLLEAAREVEWPLSRRVMDEADRAALEENMRVLRRLLPRHLVSEERGLYAEIEQADPSSGPQLAALRRLHLELEKEFSTLQGLALSRSVSPEAGHEQRKAAQAARAFRARLEALSALKEEGPFALAARLLTPQAMERVADAIEATAMREELKAMQGR
jgi:hypothetical protein